MSICFKGLLHCGGGGGRRMWIKKFLNVNIINFEKVDKPKGGGSDNVDKVFC